MSVQDKLTTVGPKKILSCDGGGILGLASVEILAKLEADLREKTGKPSLVLADYFDFVCGTSTGAIIATCISAGMSMSKIREFYVESGNDMFDKTYFLKQLLKFSYNDAPLANKLKSEFNSALGYDNNDTLATLGDKNLKTLLMMVLKNHTTDSAWPVSNNPHAKYNNTSRPDCNLKLPLWQLVRGSTAAPTYFKEEKIEFNGKDGKNYEFVFLDGGVTSYNNPAFLAFQMATAKPYSINWPTGKDKLLIVSVGTVKTENVKSTDASLHKVHHALNVPTSLMNNASAGWDMACRMLGHCTFGEAIDREFGEMLAEDNTSNWTGEKLFTYVRYEPDGSRKGLDSLGLNDIKEDNISKLDSVEFIGDIQQVGKIYAEKFVHLDHLRTFI